MNCHLLNTLVIQVEENIGTSGYIDSSGFL